MDAPRTPAPARVETQGSQADAPGELLCRPTRGTLPVDMPRIQHPAFLPSRTDSISLFLQDGVNKIRSGKWRKPASPPGLMNRDSLNLFQDMHLCSVSLGLPKRCVCFRFLEALISKSCCRTSRRGGYSEVPCCGGLTLQFYSKARDGLMVSVAVRGCSFPFATLKSQGNKITG